MQQVTSSTTKPVISITAARIATATGVSALILLAALHILSPEFDPSWRMVSEYASGEYSWVLSLMFLAWASSSASLFFAIKPEIQTVGGKIGLGFLLISAVGTSMAAFFDFNHSLHGLATILGVPTFPIAAMLISISLVRNKGWSPSRRILLVTANLTWICLVLLLTTLFVGLSQSGGEFNPGVLIGWPNRFLVLAYCGWLIVVARGAIQLDSPSYKK